MGYLKTFAAAGLLALGSTAHADILDANAGEDSFRVSLYGGLPELFGVPTGQYDVGGVLRPEKQEDLLQLYIGGLLTSEYGAGEYKYAAGFGVRGLYVGKDHDSGGAVAVGGMAEFPIPAVPNLGFSLYAYYAPEATSFGEVRNYIEYAPSIDYRFAPDFAAYVGYRYIEYDIGSVDDVEADDSAHLGVRFNF